MRFESRLKKKIVVLARNEKRTIASQAAYLIEKGLIALELEQGHQSKSDPSVAALGDRFVEPLPIALPGKTA
jgi:hypothetical protein